jgi:hypothetical protein
VVDESIWQLAQNEEDAKIASSGGLPRRLRAASYCRCTRMVNNGYDKAPAEAALARGAEPVPFGRPG